jgi:hypothetical protein
MLFMAITSTGSAECIAVSSLWAYDGYRRYINPAATGKQILMHSRVVVCVWALCMACFSLILNEIGVSLGWVYNFMGIMIGSAVPPIAAVLTVGKISSTGAMAGAGGGMICAIIAWLAQAASQAEDEGFPSGEVSIDTTGFLYAQLAGNCVAIGSSTIIMFTVSILSPQNYDFSKMNDGIKLVGGDGGENAKVLGADWESSPEFLESAYNWIMWYGIVGALFLTVAWPAAVMPWAVFQISIYSIWASIALVWGYIAGITIISLPLYENRATIWRVLSCKPFSEEDAAKNAKVVTQSATA